MADISSNGTGGGNYSSGSSWVGGAAPAVGDTFTVVDGDTITIDTLTCAADSYTVDSGGILTCSTIANTKLTLENGAVIDGTLTLDLSSTASYSHQHLFNNSSSSGIKINCSSTSNVTIKGYSKTRWTNLNGLISVGATSAVVDDATGWNTGDRVIFGTTTPFSHPLTPAIDNVASVTVSGNNLSWTGGNTYEHKDFGYVGNFSSNMEVSPVNANDPSCLFLSNTYYVTDVLFSGYNRTGYAQEGVRFTTNSTGTFENNIFYEFDRAAIYFYQAQQRPVFTDCIFYTSSTSTNANCTYSNSVTNGIVYDSCIVFAAPNARGLVARSASTSRIIDCVVMATKHPYDGYQAIGVVVENSKALQCVYAAGGDGIKCIDCDFGDLFGAKNQYISYMSGYFERTFINCKTGYVTAISSQYLCTDGAYIRFANRDNDATLQETYTNLSATDPTIEWNGTEGYGGDPCWKVNTTTAGTWIVEIPWAAIPAINDTVTLLIGRVKRTNSQPVTLILSGLGLTPYIYTCSGANDTWEQFYVLLTNNTGNNGTLSLKAEVTSGNAGAVYFSDFSYPTSEVIRTGNMSFAQDGLPVGIIMSSSPAARDILAIDKDEILTLTGSYGKYVLDTLAAVLVDTGTTLDGKLITIEGKVDTIDTVVDTIVEDTGTTLPSTLAGLAPAGEYDTELADIQADLNNPDQYKADVSGLAPANEYDAALTAIQADLDNPTQYRADLSGVIAAIAALNNLSQADVQAAMEAQGYVATIESGYDFKETQRIVLAMLAGILSGITEGSEEDTVIFKQVGGSKDRVTITTDGIGNRTAVVIDVSD